MSYLPAIATSQLTPGGEGDLAKPIAEAVEAVPKGSFDNVLAELVDDTARLGNGANIQAAGFAQGTMDDLHGAMISAKEAEISLKLVGSVRNKLLDAFHELWRISV